MSGLLISIVVCGELGGAAEMITIGEKIGIQSEVLGEERILSICTPYEYENTDRAYPVLIILDCGTATSLAHAMSTMEMLDGKSLAPQLIVVGIDAGPGVRDYFPLPVPGRSRSGEADLFLEFISKEVVPLVNSRYRTAPFRVIYGASNAGMFTVYAMLENTDAFSAVIAASPSLGWYPDFFSERIAEFSPDHGTRLYINWATDDLSSIVLNAVPELAVSLKSRFSEADLYAWEIIEDGGHVPYVSLYNGLRHVFNGWRYPEEALTANGLSGLHDHYSGLSQSYGFSVTPPAGGYMTLGQFYLQNGDSQEALEVFQEYSGCYENSSMAFFFLGESQRAMGLNSDAGNSYQRAVELNPGLSIASERLETISGEE